MGFRNPIRSLRADQITGQIQGTQLAADAIDGKTITGALIRTAAAGKRVELGSAPTNKALFWPGTDYDFTAGALEVDAQTIGYPAERGYLRATAPVQSDAGAGGEVVTLTLYGASAHAGVYSGLIELQATQVSILSDLEVNGGLTVGGKAVSFDPEVRFYNADSAGEVGNSVGLGSAVNFAALSYATKVIVQAEGSAGLHAAAVHVGLRIGVGGGAGWSITRRTEQKVLAPANDWTAVTASAQVNIPAGVAVGVYMATLCDATAAFRAGMSLIRVPA